MGDVTSLYEDKNKSWEEAHCTCRELMQDQLQKIEDYNTKWILVGLSVLLLLQVGSFVYYYFEIKTLKKVIDYRYFLTKESLEDIHGTSCYRLFNCKPSNNNDKIEY